jgi:hypothetical protein
LVAAGVKRKRKRDPSRGAPPASGRLGMTNLWQ